MTTARIPEERLLTKNNAERYSLACQHIGWSGSTFSGEAASGASGFSCKVGHEGVSVVLIMNHLHSQPGAGNNYILVSASSDIG